MNVTEEQTPKPVRILLLADTHIGFDLPTNPRVRRRRRGHDFLANYERALAPAFAGKVDLVVHGGDLFHRSRVAKSVAWQGLEPLVRVADAGVPVFIVPGNHERSRIPYSQFARHANLSVFDRPRTFNAVVRGTRVALAGFPYVRSEVRSRFPEVLESTGWQDTPSDVRLLCIHHCVEGATVGPSDYTFTTGRDVIRTSHLPTDFAAVLSGHIHRQQVLRSDLQGNPISTPVIYPGSIERTSIAEKDELKGFMIIEIHAPAELRYEFRRLPARPMFSRELDVTNLDSIELEAGVRALLDSLPADAVLRIRVRGNLSEQSARILSGDHLRRLAPGTMNIDVRPSEGYVRSRRKRRRSKSGTIDLPFPEQ